ncbi:MAG: hypothetical protein OSA04_02765, partial [Flavobacteriales bacterium]|nr:hypothetical protein [Flavobacteriales bacterium]
AWGQEILDVIMKTKQTCLCSLARNTVALTLLGSVFMSRTHRELMFGMKSFERFALRITPSIET